MKIFSSEWRALQWKLLLAAFFVNFSNSQKCSRQLVIESRHFCYSDEYIYEQATFKSADVICKVINSTLPMPESDDEEAAIRGLMSSRQTDLIFLDLKMRRGTWRWQNGNELDYQGCYPITNFTSFENQTAFIDNSKAKCRRFCEAGNYTYFALFNKNGCGCMYNNSFIEAQEKASCNLNCQAPNYDQICGGQEAMSVWATNGLLSFWDPGQPNNDTGSQSCAIISKSGLWQDVECSSMNGNLCQIDKSKVADCSTAALPMCRRVSHLGPSSCLCLVDKLSNIFDAHKDCALMGGSVVQIDSSSASTQVTNILNEGVNVNSQFWIGLKKWEWIRTDGRPLLYTHWASGEPTDLNGECALLKESSSTWVTTDCDNKHKPICQKVTKIILPSSAPSTTRIFIPRTTTKIGSGGSGSDKEDDLPNQQNNSVLTKDLIGAIVGGACGFLIILIIAVIVISCCCCQCHNKNKSKRNSCEPIASQINLDPSRYETVNNPSYFFGLGTVNKPVENLQEVGVKDKTAAAARDPAIRETKLVSVATDTMHVTKEDMTASSKSLFDIDWSAGNRRNNSGNGGNGGNNGNSGNGSSGGNSGNSGSGGNGGNVNDDSYMLFGNEARNVNTALGLL